MQLATEALEQARRDGERNRQWTRDAMEKAEDVTKNFLTVTCNGGACHHPGVLLLSCAHKMCRECVQIYEPQATRTCPFCHKRIYGYFDLTYEPSCVWEAYFSL